MVKAANLVGKISSLCISFPVKYKKETFIRQEKIITAVLISKDFKEGIKGHSTAWALLLFFSSCSLLVVGSWVRRVRCVF